MQSLILTVIGPDRPGLVDALSHVIKARNANWLQSHLAQLAGQFAGIVHVQVAENEVDGLTADLLNLQHKGLTLTVTPGDPHLADAMPEASPFHLELLGLDRPGIVRDLASALASRNINVTELETDVVSAPMSGEPLFKATARLTAPTNVDADELHDALDRIADQLDLDLHLTAPQPSA